MLFFLITSRFARISSTRYWRISSGFCTGTITFTASIFAFMSAVSAISAIFAFIFSLISLGVPAGAQIENQMGISAFGNAELSRRGHIRKLGMTLGAVDVEQDQLACLDVRQGHGLVHHVHHTWQMVVERIRATAIGHMQDVDAELGLDGLQAKMICHTDSR